MTTQRWTDEMLDDLAVSIQSLRDTVLAHDRQNEGRDQQMDLMAIGINRLLEDSREYKQWKVENDQRFNILLAELRAMNRRVEVLEN
jgi:hypothetical protein